MNTKLQRRQVVQPKPSLLALRESVQPATALFGSLDLQDGVVAHLDRVKIQRDNLLGGDMKARLGKLLRYTRD